MHKYLVLEINNLEPLKIGSRGVQNHVENSKSHIPGSTIRGAVIYYLIKELKLDRDLCVKGDGRYRKQLLEDMKCFNAYPVYDDKVFFPVPIHLKTDKHEYRKKVIKEEKEFKAFGSLLDETKYKNALQLEYTSFDDSTIKAIEVSKEFRLHHNKCENIDNLFRYEAIKKGYKFRTIIVGSQEVLTAIEKGLEKNNEWYLGGSKGSGYGLCNIKKLSICKTYRDAKEKLGLKFKSKEENNLIITCLSDCIFRDDKGNPSNYIPVSELEKVVGKKNFEIERSIVEQGYSEGYNVKWGLRYPKESTVKAGSVIKYICDKLSKDDLVKIEEKLYGVRTTDGYGWIAVNVEHPYKIDLNIITDNNRRENNQQKKPIKPSNEIDSLDIIIKGLGKAKKKWLRHIFLKERESKSIKVSITNKSIRENMLKLLKKEISANKTILSRPYMNNKDKFSIKESTFKDIYDYCCEKGDKPILDDYVENKLNTFKGSLFYKATDKRKLLMDIAILSLELGGENHEQDS